MTATFTVLWIVCAIGALTFASIAARHAARLRAFICGTVAAFAGAAAWGPPDAPIVGVLAAAAAAIALFRPRHAWLASAAGGVLAGLWPGLLRLQGVPAWPAVGVTLAALALTMWLSRSRPSFAPALLHDDALLVLLAAGTGLAILPTLLDGWQSAVTLNAGASPSSEINVPLWLMAAVASSLALGAAHSLWSRR